MRSFAVCLALAIWPGAISAQDWATTEVCTVDEARIYDEELDPPGRDVLEAEAAKIENRRGRFWQITDPNGATSFLWGTFHSTDPLILDLPQTVRDAIAASRVVAIEVDYVLKSREAYREAQFYEGMFRPASDPFNFLPNDETVAGLPAEISNWIINRAIELGWTEDVNLILSPAGMADMLLSDPCEDFSSAVLPIQDDYVQLLGRVAGAEVLGLEEPFQMIDDMAAEDARATAEAIIAVYGAYLKPVDDNKSRATAFAMYREGRLGLMAAWDAAYLNQVLGNRGPEALRMTDDYLLGFRNVRFLERLRPELSEGGVFVAVGAGHLPGEDGLVAMLRREGYELTRVPLPGEAE